MYAQLFQPGSHLRWQVLGPIFSLALLSFLSITLNHDKPYTGLARAGIRPDLPMLFVPNTGQTSPEVQFQAQASRSAYNFTEQGVAISLPENPSGISTVKVVFIGANQAPRISGVNRQIGTVNYLTGRNPAGWHTNLPAYSGLVYKQIYPGIDLAYEGQQRRLKGTFTVAPGSDSTQIQWQYQGASKVAVEATTGNLQIKIAGAIALLEAAPIAWQIDRRGIRIPVVARYLVSEQGSISFVLGNYDRSLPLVLDPTLSFSTYLGGSRTDQAYDVAVDGAGNTYVVGVTESVSFPIKNPVQGAKSGLTDVFVTKLNPAGEMVYSTYLGGNQNDEGLAVAADSAGNAYVTGTTLSNDFPTLNALQRRCNGQFGLCLGDAFVTKLNPDGNAILYSSYLGGELPEVASGIAVDNAGIVAVTGVTFSSDFPLKNALQTSRGGAADAFVTKLDSTKVEAASLIFSTYLGGSLVEGVGGIAMDGGGAVYATGQTTSSDFKMLNAVQPDYKGNGDLYVTKFSPDGSNLIYSTFLGGSNKDYGYGIAVDTGGNAYLTGNTESPDFPLKNPLHGFAGGTSDAFVAKLNERGNELVYSTLLGGSDNDYGQAIAVNGAGEAGVVGYTQSGNFPTQDSLQPFAGATDVFIAKWNAGGTALQLSTLLGGDSADFGAGIAVDSSGNIIVAGATHSSNFPTKNAVQATFGSGLFDGFVAKLSGLGSDEGAVANVCAASYRRDTLAVEGIIAAFGSHLATANISATTKPLPTELAGTTVSVRDSSGIERLAPLFYVSPTQVNYQLPAGTSVGMAKVTIKAGNGRINSEMVRIAAVAPGQFTADASGKGYAAAIVQRNSANGAVQYEVVVKYDSSSGKWVAVPIELGNETDQVFLLLYGTGIRFRSSQSSVSVSLGDSAAEVLYAYLQPEFVGVDQVSVRLPRSLVGAGEIQVKLTVDGQVANSVTVNIR